MRRSLARRRLASSSSRISPGCASVFVSLVPIEVKGHRAYVSFCEFLVVLADLRTMAFHIAGATHQARESTPLPGTLPAILLARRFGWRSRVLGRFREPPSKIVQTCLCFLCLDGEF